MEKIKRTINESPTARWGILILLGIILSANYYFYDALSTLKYLLKEQFEMSGSQYGIYVSFYSVPNTFLLMAVIGGIILDKLGIRRTGFLFIVLMVVGALLTAYGTTETYQNGGMGYQFMSSFAPKHSAEIKMLYLGRVFFWLGAEKIHVVVCKNMVKMLKGK